MGSPMNNGRDNGHNEEEFFEDESSGKGMLWLAAFILAVLAGVVIWLWFARGPGFRNDIVNKIENTRKTLLDSPSEAYEVMKEKLMKELETSSTSNVEKNSRNKEQNREVAAPKVDNKTEQNTTESLHAIQSNGASERGIFSSQAKDSSEIKGKDDTVVRIDFINNLAAWLVKNYTPSSVKGKTGVINVTLQEANLRYGTGMIGLSWVGEDPHAGRAAILRYVFTPSMLDALYNLYIDRFITSVREELSVSRAGKRLSLRQKQEFYRLYAVQFRGISGALQGIAAIPNFTSRMNEIKEASQHVVAASNKYTEIVYHCDRYRDKGNTSEEQQIKKNAEVAGKAYQDAVITRERVLKSLVLSIKQNASARLLDDSSLLYLAHWIDRRIKKSSENMDAVLQAATIFLDLAKRFEIASGTIQQIEQ